MRDMLKEGGGRGTVAKITDRCCEDFSLYICVLYAIILLSSQQKSIAAASWPSGEDKQSGR